MGLGRLRAIHQVVAGFAPRDAISQHVLAARALFRDWGLRSDIYSGSTDPGLAAQALPGEAIPPRLGREELVVVHYSIDSPAFARAAASDARLAIHYHNITPARFLWRHAPKVAAECERGRRRLPALAGRVEASWADSAFNAAELAAAGFASPEALGILRPLPPIAPPAGRRPGPPRLLFVGRGIPNKAQHDLVLALAALHESGCPAELTLVGSWDAAPGYLAECRRLAARLGVDGALAIAGSVADGDLLAAYRDADLFLCLSDHEGFCVPLLEAMAAGLPIVAFAAGAVPETVGEAGLLLPEKSPSLVAEAVLATLERPALAERMARARPRRLAELAPEAVAGRLRQAVEALG